MAYDPVHWLLEECGPGVRYLALRDLVCLPEGDAELRNACRLAHQEGPIAQVLKQMDPQGYWVEPGPGYNPKYRSTVWALTLLAQLGARVEEDERLQAACSYYLDHALTAMGQFSATGAPSGTIDCLQGNLCWALVELGCQDPRLEKAWEWMSRTVSGEGIAPREEKNAPLRYYTSGKSGPGFACVANNNLPCAWGAAKVMLALAKVPADRQTPLIRSAIQSGVDFLFGVDPASALYPSGTADHPSSSWWKFGFPVFYITDILQIAEALAANGSARDERLNNTLALIREKQDAQGRWALEYDYRGKTWVEFGEKKTPNPWVTLRALRVLKAAGEYSPVAG